MTPHTPTPWEAWPDGPENRLGYRIAQPGPNVVLARVDWKALNKEANAAFIIRAVNNHDALVEALRELLGGIEAEDNGNTGSLARAQQKAVNTLKVAKEP